MGQSAHLFPYKRVDRAYLLHLPDSYDATSQVRWPLIMFFHGSDERGSNLELIKKHGIPNIAEQRPDFPFIAVSPQCPSTANWVSYAEPVYALLNELIKTLAVDVNHIYLTGLSMGGNGTWYLASKYPERFAAIAPICGFGFPRDGFPQRVCTLKDVPVWTFHGAQDPIVPIAATEQLVQTLKACGGNVRFTIYPDAAHDSWTATYNNPALYSWLLSHTKTI